MSISEHERLARRSQRAAIVLPRIYATPPPAPMVPVYDLLVFGDEHPFNITALRWFLSEVWRPLLEPAGVTVAIAGRVGHHARDLANGSPLLYFLGFVEDLDALRLTCRLTVVVDRQGTGTAVKTLATLAAGHPMVSTSVGLRGLDPAVSGLLPAHDDAHAFASDVLELLDDPDLLADRRRMVAVAHAAIERGPDHAALLGLVPRPTPRVRREREALWTRLTVGAVAPDRRSYRFQPGVWFPMTGSAWDRQVLRDGWHAAEPWGRWTDGADASFFVALTEPATEALILELDMVPSPVGAAVSLTVEDGELAAIWPAHGPNSWDLPPLATMGKAGFLVRLHVSETVGPTRSGDARVLGVGVRAVRFRLGGA